MNQSERSFRDRLLAAEKVQPTEKYRKEMAQLLERKLAPLQRTIIALVSVGSLASGLLMGWLAVAAPRGLPELARIGLGIGAIGGVVLAVLSVGVVRRGMMRRKTDPTRITNILFIVLVFSATVMLALMGQVSDAAKAVTIGLYALMMLGMASLFLVLSRVEQIELRTREKLLEIELEVQKLAEQNRSIA